MFSLKNTLGKIGKEREGGGEVGESEKIVGDKFDIVMYKIPMYTAISARRDMVSHQKWLGENSYYIF